MPAFVVMFGVLGMFAVAYIVYAKYLAQKVYVLDPDFEVPAVAMEDGVDYVPTNKHVLFGHHFTSIAGAAPIVGPAIAVFWGWGPALAWVTLGTIFAAGVHDMGSLVVSVRSKATNIGTLTQWVINPRSRTLFLLIVFFLVTLVNAVFAIVIAGLFIDYPGAVIPIVFEIPLAVALGYYIRRSGTGALIPSIIGVILLYLMIPVGAAYPIDIAPFAEALGMGDRTLWIILLFIYGFIVSRIAVWILLQPRDYINSHQLFIALGVIALGLLIGMDTLEGPFLNTDIEPEAPHWFPFLFVTIACGAISGFHSLVASGTTAKQLAKEPDAKYVGYMGALGEGSLALGSILAVTAGIAAVGMDWGELYVDFETADDNAVGYFVEGVAGFASHLAVPLSIGAIFGAVVVVSFAATTMDTGIRLQRYIIQEIGGLAGIGWMKRSINISTALAVAAPLALALAPGDLAFGRLWALFGTTNQLTAGLALAVIAVWVMKRNRNPLAQMVPLVFLLLMTSYALFENMRDFIEGRDVVLGSLNTIIAFLAVWLIVEAVLALRAARRGDLDPVSQQQMQEELDAQDAQR